MSDRGRQFESNLWASLIFLFRIQCTRIVLFPHKTTFASILCTACITTSYTCLR
jgi:hypothetical protein